MALNKNIFYATNPARMLDALYELVLHENISLSDILIFLPSRRAVRSAEQMFVQKNNGAVLLPHLVALGEELEDEDFEYDKSGAVDNLERVIVLAKLLAVDANIGNVANALPVAQDFVRMADYLENEGKQITDIDWQNIIDDKYAEHFKSKAKMLGSLTSVLPTVLNNRETQTAVRNRGIHNWIKCLDKYKLVIVCGSTASVPATADLMEAVAKSKHGRIILSGKIDGALDDFCLDTNPYNAEYKFLQRIGVKLDEINEIDVGTSQIDFFNFAFGNDTTKDAPKHDISYCHFVQCSRESEEANAVAEICSMAIKQNKSVMVITPDAAGNQRIAAACNARMLDADFSGGVPATMSPLGRAILNMFDDLIEKHDCSFDDIYKSKNYNLFDSLSEFIWNNKDSFSPAFIIDDENAIVIWEKLKHLSDILVQYDMHLSMSEVRAFVSDCLSSITLRNHQQEKVKVVVLGTMEARMQTADVVILTGLNDGMFPSQGYENSWLPISIAKQIGLPSRDKKVSLMALDFINLSCAKEVYWLRSCISGGVQTTMSRFLSRVIARGGNFDTGASEEVLKNVRIRDDVESNPLVLNAPTPPSDWSDVYVTELELLIHNPYAFYARHILRLKPMDDYWVGPDARAFGNLVHSVIENSKDFSVQYLIPQMDSLAKQVLGENNLLFHFWHKRFSEISVLLEQEKDLLQNSIPEIGGVVNIAGRNVRARADRIWDGGVLDIKTGNAPSKKQLTDGNMPQLPLEAFILQSGGFKIKTTEKSQTPIMLFLQLKNSDVKPIVYDIDDTAQMIDAAIDKVKGLINMYSVGCAAYEYHENNDPKYRAYDDLARIDD